MDDVLVGVVNADTLLHGVEQDISVMNAKNVRLAVAVVVNREQAMNDACRRTIL